MRFLSIVAFGALVSATYVPLNSDFNRNLVSRTPSGCPAGQAQNGNGACRNCPANTFSPGGSTACQSCPTDSNSSPGSSSCTCIAGYYVNPAKQNSNDPLCIACAAGQTSTAGASSCTSCPANTFSTGGGTCKDCPAGTYSFSGSNACANLSCPAGQAPSGNSCASCPAGSFSKAGDNSCSQCAAGSISNPGSGSCTQCPSGYVPALNKSTCNMCPANTASNGSTCQSCPPASNTPAGSTSCGPQPSRRAFAPVRRAEEVCAFLPGHQWCPVFTGRGGRECVNVLTTLDSCGGCVLPEGDEGRSTGRDCSLIPNVNEVRCERGRCKILSCRSGYVAGQGACVPAAGHNPKVKRGVLHATHDMF